MKRFARGSGLNERFVCDILPQTEPARHLLVVEVRTPSGHSSSYPPHKHDTDNLPPESSLEETYYHRLDPTQGFAFQRVYTDDRALDESLAPDVVIDRDLDFTNQIREHWFGPPYNDVNRERTATGLAINKYPVGMALTLSPAFVFAHGLVLGCRAFWGDVPWLPLQWARTDFAGRASWPLPDVGRNRPLQETADE